MSTIKYGLNIQKKTQPGIPSRPPARTKKLFDDDDDDDAPDPNAAQEIGVFDLDSTSTKPSFASTSPSKPSKPLKSKPNLPVSQFGHLSSRHTQRKLDAEAMAIDASIYDYDGAWDAMNAKSAAKAATDREDAQLRKPKYINNLLASAEVRKRDQLRAKDKMLQRERDAEGDEFADKESFVTDAYKKQQGEMKKLEEEEKLREEAEAKKKGQTGMQGFYRKMMDEDEKRHREAMEAAEQAKGLADEGLLDSKPAEKTDVDIARELNKKGGNIIINEEGQVADKRQLLSAGLNVVSKPKPAPTAATSSAFSRGAAGQSAYQGRTSTQKGVRERQSQMIQDQLEQSAKRAADDEAEERRKLEHAAKSRKTEGEISSAKERYLQRKREAAAKAKGA